MRRVVVPSLGVLLLIGSCGDDGGGTGGDPAGSTSTGDAPGDDTTTTDPGPDDTTTTEDPTTAEDRKSVV